VLRKGEVHVGDKEALSRLNETTGNNVGSNTGRNTGEKTRKSKNFFSSHFTFPILSKLHQGFRPSQIANQLGVTPQDIHYHIDRMIEAGLIYKDTSNGVLWRLTEKGTFILKHKLTGSVNSFNIYQTRPIPIRLDNLAFEFKITNPIPINPNLRWKELDNDVYKCSLKYDTYTIELIRSEKSAFMLIHLDKKYCFDWTRELINQYNLALLYVKQAATKFSLQISEVGMIVKRPHIAFEKDLIALFTAASHTAEVKTDERSRAWVDSSNGQGEFETNNIDYAYQYLTMPRTIEEIANMTLTTSRQIIGYERCYHPGLTVNN
jgi:DNA-binding Lrp family transcriptional regulator